MLKNLKKKIKDQRGLTLIELLAVIVILGIIAAIAVPSILGIIDKSKKDAKVAEAVQIISAAKLYVTTNSKATYISTADLTQYLDNDQDTGNDFFVKVDNVSSKYTYTLAKHDAAAVVNGTESGAITAVSPMPAATAAVTVSEDELLKYTNAK